MTSCSKPGCASPGAAILAYDYGSRRATLRDASPGPISPHLYALCAGCAERITPPRGWTLSDERCEPSLFIDPADRGLVSVDRAPGPDAAERRSTGARQVFFGTTA